jgi:uncharacterized LabA/DUF88 family protein
MERYALFIDGGYFKKVLKSFCEPKVSYLKLSEIIANGEERLRTYYYDCCPFVSQPPTPEERARKSNFDRFQFALERQPRFQFRLGRLAKRMTPTGFEFEQKQVDTLLSIDLVKLSVEKSIRRAVLIAGDSDYIPAIKIARDEGVIVQLYYSEPAGIHQETLTACDDRFIIDVTLIDKIRII